MVEPHFQLSPPLKEDGSINSLIFNSIFIWFFLPKAAVTPVVNPNTPEPSYLDLPLLYTVAISAWLNTLILGLRKKKEGERGGRA